MEITYIHHSSFCIEFDSEVMIFDYYKGHIPEFNNYKKIYVFASHKHHDHFDLRVFDLSKKYYNIIYIFGNDIKLSEKYLVRKGIGSNIKNNIFNIKSDQELYVDKLYIRALNSTDQGAAFLIKLHDKTIYHSGDLNWWHWEGESLKYNSQMEKLFKKEIDKIKEQNIDIAFFPLDPRQENNYKLGLDYFMRTVNVRFCFPMHFWEDYSVFDSIKKDREAQDYINKIMIIEHENQKFNF